jgi:hypothetical protein
VLARSSFSSVLLSIGCILTQFVFRVYHYYIKTVLELPGYWAMAVRWFEGFDRSLMVQLPSHKRGLLASSPGGTLNGPSSPQGADSSPYRSEARKHALERNEREVVAPLSGVAVAVFSEGPHKEKRDEDRRRAKYGEKGVLGQAITPERKEQAGSSDTGTGAPAPAGVSPNAGGLEEYHYHAMEGGTCTGEEERKQPVVVAGEIAEQEEETRARSASPKPLQKGATK